MTRQIREALLLFVLSIRDMLASAGPVLLLALGLLAAAYWWLDPQPPRTVTLATGPAGSAYAEFGQRYAEALKRDGRPCAITRPTWPSCAVAAPT